MVRRPRKEASLGAYLYQSTAILSVATAILSAAVYVVFYFAGYLSFMQECKFTQCHGASCGGDKVVKYFFMLLVFLKRAALFLKWNITLLYLIQWLHTLTEFFLVGLCGEFFYFSVPRISSLLTV